MASDWGMCFRESTGFCSFSYNYIDYDYDNGCDHSCDHVNFGCDYNDCDHSCDHVNFGCDYNDCDCDYNNGVADMCSGWFMHGRN